MFLHFKTAFGALEVLIRQKLFQNRIQHTKIYSLQANWQFPCSYEKRGEFRTKKKSLAN